MSTIQLTVSISHPDFALLHPIVSAIIRNAGGEEELRQKFPALIRRAIDEVIDTPRSKRLKISQLEKTEKTYIGTKIEILLRDFLKFPKGILDLNIDGIDVDIKNTIGKNWMIPTEAIGKACILISSDDKIAKCYLGVIIAKIEYLNSGSNKDNKRSISAYGSSKIQWILERYPYPKNFWETIPDGLAYTIMSGSSGNERIIRLFSSVTQRPIHRDIIAAVAQQKDYMKRLRKNGGARDYLSRNGIALLSGKYDALAIEYLGLTHVNVDHFISYNPKSETEKIYLRAKGYID